MQINNALPFSSSEINFVPFKRPRISLKITDLNQDFSNINITTIGKLEKRKRLIFSLHVAEELIRKNIFKSISIYFFTTYKDMESKKIMQDLKSYSENLTLNYEKLKIYFYDSANNFDVLTTLGKSHLYLHPADNEPASYSIVEAFSCGAFVISQENCFTSDYLPYFECRKKFKNITPKNVSNFILDNFEMIANKKNRTFRSTALFKIK